MTQPRPSYSSPLREVTTEAYDAFDVPAAVLCAVCGHADCDGCMVADDLGSGVVAIVPWERPGPSWTRLWSTAQAATVGAETFFGALPSGPVAPALRFAVLAEALAVASMLLAIVTIAAAALPGLALDIAIDPSLRTSALGWLGMLVPAVTAWMIGLHAFHGMVLDRSARRRGARPQSGRSLRFGLYACGWDLMTSPLGGVVTLFTQGVRAALELVVLAMTVPSRAALALLRGICALDESQALLANRRAVRLTMLVTAASVIALTLLLGALLS